MGRVKTLGIVTVVVGTVAIATACGSGDSTFDDGSGTSSGGASSSGEPPPAFLLGGDASTLDGGDELQGCATETRKADPLPLDIVVMYDTSGSMALQVAQGVTKHEAVGNAVTAFVQDPTAAGIGVGLQFFPLNQAGVPASCATSADCPGATGPCSTQACAQNGPLVFCDIKQDCAGPAACAGVGQCSASKNYFCFTVGQPCGTAGGLDLGTCTAQAAGFCSAADSCVATDYATPAVAVAPLPGVGPAITSAITARAPQGNTPTSAALQGAIDQATTQAATEPGHTVVVVLVTDGLPSECDTSVANIAAIASAGYGAGIRTYVIGVFTSAEAATAQANLDQIASAGGSTKAFIVTAGASTTTQLLNALNTVRGAALPCDYSVPVPESGTADYDKMNVRHTAQDGTQTIFPYATNAAGCDPVKGGWYYDVDPATGGTPTKIVLCASSCDGLKTTGGKIDVVVGCKTRVN